MPSRHRRRSPVGLAAPTETCGAVIGALMGIGLGFGSSNFEDLESYQTAREVSEQFVERFTARFGSTRCYEIQETTVGWRCDDPSRVAEWRAAEGPIGCAEAARIAADIILGRGGEADG